MGSCQVISWILLGLAGSRLKKSFAFKGGTALKKVYFPDYRYSEDLDFTFLGDLEEKVLIEGFRVKAETKKIDSRRLSSIFRQKEATLAKLWEIRLAHQVDELPHLEEVIRKTNKYFRQYGMV